MQRNELIKIADFFWHEWKQISNFVSKASWNKIVTDNDNNLWTQQVFLYFTKVAERLNLNYKPEKKRSNFMMDTFKGEKMIQIEQENDKKENKFEILKKLANSPYPLKIFIAYSQSQTFESDLLGMEAEISKIQGEHEDQAWLVIHGLNAKGSWFPSQLDAFKAFLWVGDEDKVNL